MVGFHVVVNPMEQFQFKRTEDMPVKQSIAVQHIYQLTPQPQTLFQEPASEILQPQPGNA